MKVKIAILPAICIATLSCTPPTPEQLAKDACDCYRDANKNKNSDNVIQATSSCMSLTQSNLSKLRSIEQDKDMTDEQSQAFEKRYHDAFEQCTR